MLRFAFICSKLEANFKHAEFAEFEDSRNVQYKVLLDRQLIQIPNTGEDLPSRKRELMRH